MAAPTTPRTLEDTRDAPNSFTKTASERAETDLDAQLDAACPGQQDVNQKPSSHRHRR